MFRFWKKKKEAAEVISAASTSTSIEEEMGLKEYVRDRKSTRLNSSHS